MATEIIMPKVDMVMDTGTFVEWLKDEGETVEKGEPLFVIQTDKANIEVEAPASGVLAGLAAKPDDVIPVTEIIGYVVAPGEEAPARPESAPAPSALPKTEAPVPEGPVARPAVAETLAGEGGKVRATPAARRLATDMGVDLMGIKGRGSRGRIHKADVLAAGTETTPETGRRAVVTQPATVTLPQARQRETVPLSGPRRIIAERLSYSAATAPHINLSLRVNMAEAARMRRHVGVSLEKRTGYNPSFTAIVARAVAAVLPRHPYLNASLDGDRIILWDEVHLGIATSLDDSLIVPVIRQAERKGLEQLVSELGDLVARARQKRLTPAEMSGSTFTISNLGMYGIEAFTAIINPPETAILAVGAIVDTLVPGSEGSESQPLMNLTLCADHRVVDGATGARFLADLKETLENPYLLV